MSHNSSLNFVIESIITLVPTESVYVALYSSHQGQKLRQHGLDNETRQHGLNYLTVDCGPMKREVIEYLTWFRG